MFHQIDPKPRHSVLKGYYLVKSYPKVGVGPSKGELALSLCKSGNIIMTKVGLQENPVL